MFARLPDTLWVWNVQYIDNEIFANNSSPQTSLTFQVNISSYLEFTFDRFVWTCRAAYANSSAPLGGVYLLWHFDVTHFTSRVADQAQLSVTAVSADIHLQYTPVETLTDLSEDLHTQTDPFIEGWALSSYFRERKISALWWSIDFDLPGCNLNFALTRCF